MKYDGMRIVLCFLAEGLSLRLASNFEWAGTGDDVNAGKGPLTSSSS